ncbi:AraC family transcriptional regulator [Mucilaginibacter limnophilus]|uniref:AraC family transcriptional regulator n=1 Tax=Mucilaginibacter limnophilus TaxID=1932778 RepID=A0A3S2Y0B1_9SPHI|nr:AraC family transcriptional regulator [Mucilaginibacter limnophilus]RVU00460.1 AraC family transcriptional regulator [Mucilaginibacter limnophilus]
MKPQLLKVIPNVSQSFSVRRDTVPYVNNHWHYHPEVELIYFKEGAGTQFIGDSVQHFQSGDVVLVGSYLPHYWRFDDVYFKDNVTATADVIVVHFNADFWGDMFLNLPETTLLKSTLENAKRGIQVKGKVKSHIAGILNSLLHAEGLNRIILLMEALAAIGQHSKYNHLSSMVFHHNFEDTDKDKINAIYEYSLANYKSQIKLNEIAEVANVSPNSFCRYFKSKTRKTYTQFINEIRVGNACKLLIENRINVKQICYESGFNNFASFHKFFKSITGKSPLSYQKEFLMENNHGN